MSTSAGFMYLLNAQYIDYELESWLTVSLTLFNAKLTGRNRTCST